MSTIKIYDTNHIDLLNANTTITITDTVATDNGQDIVNYMRNRSINSAWITTGSNDAANTQIDIDMGDTQTVTDILMLNHNLKSYVVSYWTGSLYTTINTTTDDDEDSTLVTGFGTIATNKIRIIIYGTQTANADKFISRLLITRLFGAFKGFPVIKNPIHTTNKTKTTLLSGLTNIVEATGSFKVELSLDHFHDTDDLKLIEDIYQARRGLNFWLCGGNEAQFTKALKGYRKKDVYLMRPEDDYSPEYYKGLYQSGVMQKMKLVEVVR